MTHTYNEHAWVHASQRGKNCNDELSKEDKSGQPFHTSIRLEYRQTDDCAGKTECQGAKGIKEDVMMEKRERMEEQYVKRWLAG